jgi:hypothetical protein
MDRGDPVAGKASPGTLRRDWVPDCRDGTMEWRLHCAVGIGGGRKCWIPRSGAAFWARLHHALDSLSFTFSSVTPDHPGKQCRALLLKKLDVGLVPNVTHGRCCPGEGRLDVGGWEDNLKQQTAILPLFFCTATSHTKRAIDVQPR